MYADALRERFPTFDPRIEDLYLLESFQIAYLPSRVVPSEFAAVLRAHPEVHRFLDLKCPAAKPAFASMLQAQPAADDSANHRALWEIADLLIYAREPALYHEAGPRWPIEQVTALCPLEGTTVADIGAGTGRLAALAAREAETVFAVEPVGALREFIRHRADQDGQTNLFAIDGFLHRVPLPTGSVDVLLTGNAIGWELDAELQEIERVVRPGGLAIHLVTVPAGDAAPPVHEVLTSPAWTYEWSSFDMDEASCRRYWRRCSASQ